LHTRAAKPLNLQDSPSNPSSGRCRIFVLSYSFYSQFSLRLGRNDSIIRPCAVPPRVYSFYDHTGANGKAFACVDVLRAHPHTRLGGSAEATSRRSRKAPALPARAMGSKVVHLTTVSRHHMQIVCISMTPQAARDNGNERRSRHVDVHSRHRYRSQRGGA